MTAVLAVDGGQSGIRLRHSLIDRTVEVEGVSRLEGDLVHATAEAVDRGWRQGRFPPTDRVMLGLTTAPSDDSSRAAELCGLVGAATGADEVWLADDAVTSHHGALSGGLGVSLIVGTGVASLALAAERPPRLFDGNGYLLGDGGGAFWIGISALRLVLRAYDGIGPDTAIREAAILRFGPIPELKETIYGLDRPVNSIAQFARDVLEIAGGDATAAGIISRAADELVATVGAAAAWVGNDPVDVAVGGKLMETGSLLRRELEERISTKVPTARLRSADASGLEGALSLGSADQTSRYDPLIHYWSRGRVR